MPQALNYTFLIHVVVSAVFGVLLLAVPGLFLGMFGWWPVDPLISRLLGAAMLAHAWASFRGWQATERTQVATLIEMQAVYTVLGCVGLLRHLLISSYPWYVWLLFAILAVFAIAWLYFWYTFLYKK